MDNLLCIAPDGAIPEITSPVYKLLLILSDGQKHPRDHLCNELGGGLRVYLQRLVKDYQYWLIHSEQGQFNSKKQAFYQLDERHFFRNRGVDLDARTIAKKQYKDRSYYGSKNAVKRLEQARQEKIEADKEYTQRIESKKPTKD